MQNVVLVLLSVLIVIVIAIVFVGYKKLASLRVQISKVQLDVISLRNFIDERVLSGGYSPMNLMSNTMSHPLPMEMPVPMEHLNPTVENETNEDATLKFDFIIHYSPDEMLTDKDAGLQQAAGNILVAILESSMVGKEIFTTSEDK